MDPMSGTFTVRSSTPENPEAVRAELLEWIKSATPEDLGIIDDYRHDLALDDQLNSLTEEEYAEVMYS